MRKYILILTVVLVAVFFNSINNSHSPVAIIYDPLSEKKSSIFEELLIEAGYDVTSYIN